MSLFTKLLGRKQKYTPAQQEQAKTAEVVPQPKVYQAAQDYSITMSRLAIDTQTVLLNADKIENKSLAELFASLVSRKYGVATKVAESFVESSYLVYIYRIDLSLIAHLYDPLTKRWTFSLSALSVLEDFNFSNAIDATEVGSFVHADLTHELQSNEDFTLLFENDYYQFYKYYSQKLIRYEKKTWKSLVIGRFVNIAGCIQYHNKLYVAETRGIIGDKDIYQCDLNGANLISLQCLNNEKIFRAGHSVSMDSVKEMHIVDDSLEITVMRNDGSNIYDYKITIRETESGIEIKHGY